VRADVVGVVLEIEERVEAAPQLAGHLAAAVVDRDVEAQFRVGEGGM